MLCTRGGKKIINYHHQTMALTQHSRQSHTQVTLNICFGEKKNEWILNNKETIKNNKLGIQDRLIMTSRCVFKTHIALGLLSLLHGSISCFTWVFQKLLACAYGRIPLCSFARSPQQSGSGYHSPPSSGQRLRPCLDPLWQAELQELERIRVNWVWNHVTLTHLEFAFYNRKRALTLLFGIFILLATLFLAFVPTLCLNHWLHSFLRFPRLLKGPHPGRASSFTALLRHTFDKQLIYVNIGNNKKKLSGMHLSLFLS